MNTKSHTKHWNKIYETKELSEVGWYQKVPETSLNFISNLNLPKTASIIDIGGGDSYLAPALLELSYTDITVLDISEKAIDRAKKRQGDKAELMNWIVSNITEFNATRKYDCWHDRAAFHFLTDKVDVENYVKIAAHSIPVTGVLIIGTFSLNGPKKCSGLPIKQYSVETLNKTFSKYFKLRLHKTVVHQTPSGSQQEFTFCSFIRNNFFV